MAYMDECDKERRLYGKDIAPPPEWVDCIQSSIDPYLLWKGPDDLLGQYR